MSMMQGGEIFVPKIPSMRMIELATLLAPDIPQKIIGIRPGEKLHEIMVPEDDGRSTLEISDRYMILPSFQGWSRDRFVQNGAVPVPDGFAYASNTNPERLDARGLQQILAQCFK